MAKEQTDTVSESLTKLKKYIIDIYDEECGILLKDEIEFRNYLHDNMIATINKLLKLEKFHVEQ